MIKVKVLIVSKDESFMMNNEDFQINENILFDVTTIANNSNSLASVYNACLNQSNEFDFVMLMHSDVKFNVALFAINFLNVSQKYDIFGFCGTSKIIASRKPLNWFTGSIPCPEHRWGCVTHGELKNMTSFFNSHSPNVTDHEVSCIDGLCIIVSRKAIDSGIRFDDSVGKFDLYDTDFSFQAVIKYKLKLGVIVQKDLQHYSVGKSILSQQFLENDKKFRQKWNIP